MVTAIGSIPRHGAKVLKEKPINNSIAVITGLGHNVAAK